MQPRRDGPLKAFLKVLQEQFPWKLLENTSEFNSVLSHIGGFIVGILFSPIILVVGDGDNKRLHRTLRAAHWAYLTSRNR